MIKENLGKEELWRKKKYLFILKNYKKNRRGIRNK